LSYFRQDIVAERFSTVRFKRYLFQMIKNLKIIANQRICQKGKKTQGFIIPSCYIPEKE